jgi:hypothetical protein
MTQPERFFDTRAAYMMFVNTTTEKPVVADRVGDAVEGYEPRTPGLRIFDAGMGDASVLSHLMRRLHRSYPHVPWLVVGKEISIEDIRQALARLPDRLLEHPETVFVVTNLTFREAPTLIPDEPSALHWDEVALEGSTTHQFAEQIHDLFPILASRWEVMTSPKTGNPLYVRPAVLILYRRDRQFMLRSLIPRQAEGIEGFDLIIAAQAYRARTSLERKVKTVIAPLVGSLAPGGLLVGIHSYGDDPGLEIIRNVWPDENPFIHRRRHLLAEAQNQLDQPDLIFPQLPDEESLFRFELHTMPSEASEHIGTSSLIAAWNAAAYVAQIDEPRLAAVAASGASLEAVRQVIEHHTQIYFNDESYLISRLG